MPDKVNRTFVIAECCSSWRFGDDHLANAFRMIELAKECDASAAKFQWTSDPALMAQRRHGEREEFDILAYPFEWLEKLKSKCDEVGIEFMVTCFIAKDIPTIAPLVKRFKVASAESGDFEFVKANAVFGKPVIASFAFGANPPTAFFDLTSLHCVCSYPTPIDQLNLNRIGGQFDGLSDHTTSVLSGAVAVGAGASIVEKHVRLMSVNEDITPVNPKYVTKGTPPDNPDYGHSLNELQFAVYVRNIREAEAMMGTGESVMQECEKVNEGRRVKA